MLENFPREKYGLPVEQEELDYFSVRKKRIKQNIAVALFLIGGVSVFVWGFFNISGLLKVPLASIWTTPVPGQEVVEEEPTSVLDEDPEVLKNRDTDGDGINDFEEVYIYKTSAYLADSDSDNFSDFDEIMRGEDPLCPKGQSCYNTNVGKADGGNESGQSDSAVNPLLSVTPDQLRALLIQTGTATKEQLAEFDDATLMSLYKEALDKNPEALKKAQEVYEQTNKNNNSTDLPVSGTVDPAKVIDNLQDVTPEQVRTLLLAQGFSEDELSQVTDEELMAIYAQALQKAKTADVKE